MIYRHTEAIDKSSLTDKQTKEKSTVYINSIVFCMGFTIRLCRAVHMAVCACVQTCVCVCERAGRSHVFVRIFRFSGIYIQLHIVYRYWNENVNDQKSRVCQTTHAIQ